MQELWNGKFVGEYFAVILLLIMQDVPGLNKCDLRHDPPETEIVPEGPSSTNSSGFCPSSHPSSRKFEVHIL
jgi:hypothetical protein